MRTSCPFRAGISFKPLNCFCPTCGIYQSRDDALKRHMSTHASGTGGRRNFGKRHARDLRESAAFHACFMRRIQFWRRTKDPEEKIAILDKLFEDEQEILAQREGDLENDGEQSGAEESEKVFVESDMDELTDEDDMMSNAESNDE